MRYQDTVSSICAADLKAGEFGVGVASTGLAVGKNVPFSGAFVGAIAVQGYTGPFFGIAGMKLLREGIPARGSSTRYWPTTPCGITARYSLSTPPARRPSSRAPRSRRSRAQGRVKATSSAAAACRDRGSSTPRRRHLRARRATCSRGFSNRSRRCPARCGRRRSARRPSASLKTTPSPT